MEEKRAIVEVIGRWMSIAVILAMTLYGVWDIWRTQTVNQQALLFKLIEAKQCENIRPE